MRAVNSNLMADILNGTIANCIKIELQNGNVFGYTDHDITLNVDGVNYVPAPGLQKVKMTLSANAEVSNQEFGSAWVDAPEEDLNAGLFDSAKVEVSWASWKNPSYGKHVVFTGQLGEITWTEDGFKADIVSFMKNLGINLGNVYRANCGHVLYGQGGVGELGKCGISDTNFKENGSVGTVTIPKWAFTCTTSKPDGYFDNGYMVFTSGNNNGLSAIIKSHAGGTITLLFSTAFVFQPGDTFTLYAGCDHTLDTCKNKFNNVVNYGGFPHITPDAMVR
jgi:uncharacterized phage protein (TIGR02218 family)